MIRKLPRLFVPPVLAALVFLGGCARSDRLPAAAETAEPEYQRGLQLKNQGKPQEALAAYLKVIARRGEEDAAESHLEAGVIYLQYIKDPIRAIYHFQKYLELRPHSQQADLVRQQIDGAKRDFARTLHPQPVESVGDRLELQEQIARLQHENEQLKAELAQPGGATVLHSSSNSGEIITLLPLDRSHGAGAPPRTDSSTLPVPLNPGSAARASSAPGTPWPTKTGVARPGTGKAAAAAPAGRHHTVAAKESLWSIARKYYGAAASTAEVERIRQANRDVLTNGDALKLGMELRIP